METNEKLIEINDVDAIRKRYKIRRSGRKNGSSVETTIPPLAFEREARRRGMTPDEAIDKLTVVWQYNSFPGLHLYFEEKED